MTNEENDFVVIGEDDEFIAVAKPACLLVHPTKPGGPRTLWDGLKELLGFEVATGGQVSIVNRLDRETSGVVVVAKSSAAARAAGLAMSAREVEKVYQALVIGWPKWDRHECSQPIARRGEFMPTQVYLERCVHPQGAPASTSFFCCRRIHHQGYGKLSLIEARPRTGRTHQIRVHLSYLGYPVVGDKLYALGVKPYLEFIDTGWTPQLESRLLLPRQALHCCEMGMLGRKWATPLPADLAGLLR